MNPGNITAMVFADESEFTDAALNSSITGVQPMTGIVAVDGP